MKPTSKLEKDLKNYNSLDCFFKENRVELVFENLSAMLFPMMNAKGLTRGEGIKASNLNEVYAYQIFSGVRRPSRDKLLCLTLAMNASLEETQNLLKKSEFAPLYARNRRDSIIIFCIEHNKTVIEVNQALYERGESIM